MIEGLAADQVAAYTKILWDTANNRGKVSRNILQPGNVFTVPCVGGMLLVITVPRATRDQRPVYVGPTPFGGTLRRRHEGDYKCSDDEVRRMLADADPEGPDHRILAGFGWSDIDLTSVDQYRNRFRSRQGDHPWLSLGTHELLERLGGWRRDRGSGAEGLTVAGIAMFGTDRAIRDPAALPQYFVDYREKLDPGVRWSDRVYPDGTWECNLFQFYVRVLPRLWAALPMPFLLKDGVRQDSTPAHEAIREAFANALVHADYGTPGGVVIERYPDRLVLENPGTLLVSLDQYRRGGVSECRNKVLQKMLMMIGAVEQVGSGVEKIREGWRARHWRPPMIRITAQPDRFHLVMPMVSLVPDETQQRLRDRFGVAIDELTPAEIQALATADLEGMVSNGRLQDLLTDHPADISRKLQRLCERGFLVSDNRRRWSTYRLPALPAGRDENQLALGVGGVGVSGPDPSPGEVGPPGKGELGPSAGESGPSAGAVGPFEDAESGPSGAIGDRWRSLDQDQRTAATLVRSRVRVPAAVMREVVLTLCRGSFLTAEQLGGLLDRDPVKLRRRVLSAMVREGLLALRYPEARNRPGQGYRSGPSVPPSTK